MEYSNAAILAQYEKNMAQYPLVKGEVDAFLGQQEETFCLYMRYLYGHMAAQDVLSVEISVMAGYARATLDAVEKMDYVNSIPAEIFFPYVLQHRVNTECLDDSRGYLLEQLLPFVAGKTMEQAALAVNYWCYAHATYTPADDRTLGPLAVLRRTLGRCGEESVLAVAALRSVGIPARQVYCPRWSHCDDNHAWVEVWIDGNWHYMGACEPEPTLDRGWFTAAASRAMLVDTKCWAGDGLYETVNCLAPYTPARRLTVRVTRDGEPVAGAIVKFQIVNYSEAYTLWEAVTDVTGHARIQTGAGDLLVYARLGEKAALRKVDLRQETAVTLPLEKELPARLAVDLVPPVDSSGEVPHAPDARHTHRLQLCQAHLAAKREDFEEKTDYFAMAAGNWREIRDFLEEDPYPRPLKEQLLSTLREKDFVDITRQSLEDALSVCRGAYPEDVFRDFILAPRIADEMLLPRRSKIRSLFPEGFSGAAEILAWMQANLEILPDQGVSQFYPDAYGCLRCRQVPAFAFDMVFVALCRAFSFPARLETATGQAQWLDAEGLWHPIRPQEQPVCLTLRLPGGQKAHYGQQLTIGAWDGQDYVTLKYPDLVLEGQHTFFLQPGRYRITATTRQIDGTASVAMEHISLFADATLEISLPADQTAGKLKQVALSLPHGPVKQLWQPGKNMILIFADPGSEPTEHLLREMLELAPALRQESCRILLVTAQASHPTVALLRQALPEVEVLPGEDPAVLAALHLQMRVGDLRLPFVVCLDGAGRGVYADANYRIGLAKTLLDVQKLLR